MVTAVSKQQFKLDFEPGITEQFRTLKQCVAAVVYGYRGGLNSVAAACDVSPSTLSRMLNENEDDPRHLPLDFLPSIIDATGDIRPLQWLAAKFLPDDAMRREAALSRIEQLLPQLMSDVATLKKGRA
jgi:hypothetical protein